MGTVYNIRPYAQGLTLSGRAVNRRTIRFDRSWAGSPCPRPRSRSISLLIAYWMIGAFLMATKRFSEYRSIGDPVRAGEYRRSFRYYDEQELLISMVFYVTTFALFLGVFIVRYHLELILSFPLIAGFVCYYLNLSFRQDSEAQSPEWLYKEKGADGLYSLYGRFRRADFREYSGDVQHIPRRSVTDITALAPVRNALS